MVFRTLVLPKFGDLLRLQLEVQRNIIRKRQAEGIAKAKAKGVYDNRKRKKKVSDKRIFELVANGFNKTEIAEALGVSRMTVHRCLSKVA
ncbi:helix-turn-helix domain-containing protein [bacterium]|nr:helix-turn-helix domain-containing protein [bacterium]